MKRTALAQKIYARAREAVVAAGYEAELTWQADVRIEDVTESVFLRELGWVIFNSGMRGAVIRKHWPALRAAFYDFSSAAAIVAGASQARVTALCIFNSKPKVNAVLAGAERVVRLGWSKVHDFLREHAADRDALPYLRSFSYIGPITVYHLAKNIGLDVAKPDRHLLRIAAHFGYDDVQAFCADSDAAGMDRIAVVDLVWWRWAATVEPAYLVFLAKEG